MKGLFSAWGRILIGYTPSLSIEITRECPLRCPGCYAYGDDHLGGDVVLRDVRDHKDEQLVGGVLRLVKERKALHVSIVGGEPLVRYKELGVLLPMLADMGVFTQVVTSAVRPIPAEWANLRRLQICVSIDGLQPEHDARRKPATYERILKHIEGHDITVHCTVTRQQVQRDGYLEEFVDFWSRNESTSKIWVSLYTPQIGEISEEILTPRDRRQVVCVLRDLRGRYPKLAMHEELIAVYEAPPRSPEDCAFAKTTKCFSPDLRREITPCQLGGNPDCSQCGCMASAGLDAITRHRLPGGLRVGSIFDASLKVGNGLHRARERGRLARRRLPAQQHAGERR